MKVQLIKKIREQLNIRPQNNKSTMLKKSELLDYAKLIYEENKMMKEILNPSVGDQLFDIQRQRQQKNITLMAFESALRQQKYKKTMLQNSIKYYQSYIQQSQVSHQQCLIRIKQLKNMNIGQKQSKLELSTFQNMIQKQIGGRQKGQAEQAILHLMKQFIEVNKSINDSDSFVQI